VLQDLLDRIDLWPLLLGVRFNDILRIPAGFLLIVESTVAQQWRYRSITRVIPSAPSECEC
jgi:hypothetical protein